VLSLLQGAASASTAHAHTNTHLEVGRHGELVRGVVEDVGGRRGLRARAPQWNNVVVVPVRSRVLRGHQGNREGGGEGEHKKASVRPRFQALSGCCNCWIEVTSTHTMAGMMMFL
jgi:hypothetical protein